ncbi:PAS domain-containing protein [Wenzhouxiangella sp. XN24]|uniref:PAS domain-containing protein n=1 Tax=Wenzhouxiangella sp. XN24 TaxID=2713569 RepID=UPI0013EB4EE9|nr:PAS domain-containing protein [Wenzhouxiangella sp. XN24]NGX17527.1 PAS domain-containing protein [Wenzhouxiangella sp. XN24]
MTEETRLSSLPDPGLPLAGAASSPAAAALSLGAAVVLAGLLLISLSPGWLLPQGLPVGAPRPTALLVLVFLSVGITALVRGRHLLQRICGMAGLIVVGLAGLHWATSETTSIGPPGVFGTPLIALPWMVILALGCGMLFLASLGGMRPYRGTVAWASGLVLLAASIVIASDNLLGLGAIGWQVSPLGSVVVILIAAALTAALLLQGKCEIGSDVRLSGPSVAGLGTGLLAGVIWLGLVHELQLDEARVAERSTAGTRALATELVTLKTEALQRLAWRVERAPPAEREAVFLDEGQRYLDDTRAIAGLAWLDRGGDVVHALSKADGDAWRIVLPDQDPRMAAARARAATTGRPALSAPMEMGRGYTGAQLVLPLASGQLAGQALVAAVRFAPLFEALAAGESVRITDDGQALFMAGNAAVGSVAATTLDVHGRRWQIEARPPPSRHIAEVLPELVLVAGLFTAGFLAAALLLARRARQSALRTQEHFDRYQAASEALEASKRGIVQALEITSDAVVILDHDWRYVYANPMATILMHRSTHELVGKTALEVFPELGSSGFATMFENAMARREAGHREDYFAPLGTWLEVRVHPHPEGIVIYFRDVSERRQAFDRVVRSEQLLVRAQKVARLGAWELDLGTSRMTWSEQVRDMFGLGTEGSSGTFEAFLELVHPDDRDYVASLRTSVAEGRDSIDAKHRILHRDGTVHWIHERAERTEAPDGSAILAGTAQDITELQAGREAIVARDRFFELSIDMFCIAGMDGYFRQVNPAFSRVLGHSADVLLAEPWINFVHPDDVAATQDARLSLQQGRRIFSFENRFRCADGAYRWLSWVSMPVGEMMYGVARDVTESRRMEASLRRALDDLQSRNRELEEFAFVASHDLQEPLRKIRTFSDRLVSTAPAGLDEQARDYLARITAASRRMQVLIDDLLSYSRISTRAKPFGQVPLAEVVAEALADLDTRIDETGARVIVEDLPVIEADRSQLRQVMHNLLANSLKFTAAGRAPRVRVHAERSDEENAPGVVRVIVEDNGIGFDMQYAERIFSPFQRLHGRSMYRGTGMGLAIVRRIVERHGGRITARGMPGQGAVFSMMLPLVQAGEDRSGVTQEAS